MLKKIDHEKMGGSNLGWLRSTFHFSFAEYYNPQNINFGVLRVFNDDLVDKNRGFDLHPHRDMEILSYVVDGALTHGDNMGNEKTIMRGDVQYMSAGTGVYHSEHNFGDETLRLIQVWIMPDQKGYKPQYGEYKLPWDSRKDKWLHIVSGKEGNAPVKMNQDVNFYVTELSNDNTTIFPVDSGRQAYLVLLEGKVEINGLTLNTRDALEVTEEPITINATEKSHIMLIEMAKTS